MSTATAARLRRQRDDRSAEHFTPFHERSRTREPKLAYDLYKCAASLVALTVLRAYSIGSDNVPQSGPVILAPTHRSSTDHGLVMAFISRRVRFMGKSELFVSTRWCFWSHMGVFPVRRGHRDEEAIITAKTILDQEGAIVVYCEGTRSRDGRWPVQPHLGLARLALETGAPIVPVAIRRSSFEFPSRVRPLSHAVVEYGAPFRYEQVEVASRHQQWAVASEIMHEIQAMQARPNRRWHRRVAQHRTV